MESAIESNEPIELDVMRLDGRDVLVESGVVALSSVLGELDEFPEDVPTLVASSARPAFAKLAPARAPHRLVRSREAWVADLPAAAQQVLLEAASLTTSWPLAERLDGAVARPRQRIPSLRPTPR